MLRYPWINRLYTALYPAPPAPAFTPPAAPAPAPSSALLMSGSAPAPARQLWHDGDKYPGGFGYTELLTADYWTLRKRSVQLFKTNIYARGIVRRLVTNIINTGLALESTPEDAILGQGEDALAVWSELVENRVHL